LPISPGQKYVLGDAKRKTHTKLAHALEQAHAGEVSREGEALEGGSKENTKKRSRHRKEKLEEKKKAQPGNVRVRGNRGETFSVRKKGKERDYKQSNKRARRDQGAVNKKGKGKSQ